MRAAKRRPEQVPAPVALRSALDGNESLAGLMAARVLSEHFDEVVLLERDAALAAFAQVDALIYSAERANGAGSVVRVLRATPTGWVDARSSVTASFCCTS